MMLSRNNYTIITAADWVKEGDDLWWYTVQTDITRDRQFRIVGSYELNLAANQRDPDTVRNLMIGTKMTIGQLHAIPVNRGLAAMISPGIFMEIGIMQDGLNDLCGPLIFAHFKDNTSAQNGQATDTQRILARSAAAIYACQGRAEARKALEMSRLFERVYDDAPPFYPIGPAWGAPDVWELR